MTTADRPDMDLAARVARLTAGQRECLDLVDDHATSKEIARKLGISRHTVDARLRGAIQTLGVSSRREAAIIYRAASQASSQAQAYHQFAYQPPQIVGLKIPAALSPHEHDSQQRGSRPQRQQADPAFADADADSGMVPGHMQATASQHAAGDHVADSAAWTAPPFAGITQLRAPFRLWGGANDLTPPQRLFAILIVTILSMMAFGMFLTGIEALTLLRS